MLLVDKTMNPFHHQFIYSGHCGSGFFFFVGGGGGIDEGF